MSSASSLFVCCQNQFGASANPARRSGRTKTDTSVQHGRSRFPLAKSERHETKWTSFTKKNMNNKTRDKRRVTKDKIQLWWWGAHTRNFFSCWSNGGDKAPGGGAGLASYFGLFMAHVKLERERESGKKNNFEFVTKNDEDEDELAAGRGVELRECGRPRSCYITPQQLEAMDDDDTSRIWKKRRC